MIRDRFAPLLFITGTLLCGLAGLMLLPAIADASASNPDWKAFTGSASVTLFVAIGLLLTSRTEAPMTLSLRQAFLLTAGGWVTVSIFSALPFLLFNRDLGLANAVFEAVSGLTTTGSTVLVNLDAMPPGILLWRSLLQWLGGLGIIVTAMTMLPFLKVGGMQLFRTESSDQSEKVVPRAGQLAAYVATTYGTLTIACAVAYMIGGMTPFDAVNHAMTTLATGGYSTHDASFGFFADTNLDLISIVFMILGGLPFVLYIRAVKGDPLIIWRDSQVRAFLGYLGIAIALVALSIEHADGIGFLDALRRSAFNITSIVTTTGYANEDYQLWGPFAIGAFFLCTLSGACAGSTSGGVKIYRFQIAWKICLRQLRGLIEPNSISQMSFNGRRLQPEILSSVLTFLFMYLASLVVLSVALTATGVDLLTAVSGVAQSLANVGPGLGPIIGPAGNFLSLPDSAKYLLAAAMLLGRLELLTVLVLFQSAFWKW
jgi:trk system potassium uptake protein TrkH